MKSRLMTTLRASALGGPCLALAGLLVSCGGTSLTAPPQQDPPVNQPAPPPQQPGTGTLSDILVPAQGALLGHYYGAGTIGDTDARIGRKPAIHLVYYDWVTDWTTAPTTLADFGDGRIPLINWEPFNVVFDDVISGKQDATILARAEEQLSADQGVRLVRHRQGAALANQLVARVVRAHGTGSVPQSLTCCAPHSSSACSWGERRWRGTTA